MDAKRGLLTPLDIAKLWLRKFLRLAPAYYIMWLLIWTCTSRAASGPLWHLAEMNTHTCSDDWLPTLYMAGNLPAQMDPYVGCYQMAWPLQVDMQVALVIPFLAMIMWSSHIIGCLLCLGLIVAGSAINFHLVNKYNLTIGLIDTNNFFLL